MMLFQNGPERSPARVSRAGHGSRASLVTTKGTTLSPIPGIPRRDREAARMAGAGRPSARSSHLTHTCTPPDLSTQEHQKGTGQPSVAPPRGHCSLQAHSQLSCIAQMKIYKMTSSKGQSTERKASLWSLAEAPGNLLGGADAAALHKLTRMNRTAH